MYNILICDDEADIVSALKIYLTSPDINFLEARTGREAVGIVEKEDVHLILLDIMMPEMDGITAAARICELSTVSATFSMASSEFLSAKSEDSDKILGLNVGADDYVTKPFNPVEVTARVRSQLRRYFTLGGREKTPERIVIGGLEIDDVEKKFLLDGEEVALTPKEYEILKLLMSNPGKVYAPGEIYTLVWKESAISGDNTVAVHIRHLREKIEINPAEPRYLKVVWGQGYKIAACRDQ